MAKYTKDTFQQSELCTRIRRKMARDGFEKIYDLAQATGISISFLTCLFNGAQSAAASRRTTMEKVAVYLNISLSKAYTLAGAENVDKSIDIRSEDAQFIMKVREKLGFSKYDASLFFGLGRGAFGQYESDKRKPQESLLILLRILDRNPKLVNEMSNPDPRQAHSMYFTHTRKKMGLTKRDASKLFGFGKGAFIQIEAAQRPAPVVLCMLFKMFENHPRIFSAAIKKEE
ncbi:transcriptional regulator with XRE-family HTH domain [Oxalobacteraceae bacterium GrIS 2.11]